MIIDLIIIAVIVICVFAGAKRGLILSLLSVLSLVIALFVGYLLMPVVGNIIEHTSFPNKTEKYVYTFVYEEISEKASLGQSSYKDALEESSLPTFIKNKVESVIGAAEPQSFVEEISHSAAQAVTGVAVRALAVLSVAVIVFIGLTVVRILWKGIRNFPVLHQLDTVGGLAFGLIQGILLISAFMLLLGLISAGGSWQSLARQVQDSTIGAFFYGHNFLGALVAIFVK